MRHKSQSVRPFAKQCKHTESILKHPFLFRALRSWPGWLDKTACASNSAWPLIGDCHEDFLFLDDCHEMVIGFRWFNLAFPPTDGPNILNNKLQRKPSHYPVKHWCERPCDDAWGLLKQELHLHPWLTRVVVKGIHHATRPYIQPAVRRYQIFHELWFYFWLRYPTHEQWDRQHILQISWSSGSSSKGADSQNSLVFFSQ